MDMKEAMRKRHTVRKYVDKAIPVEMVKLMNQRIAENNSKYNLYIQLVTNDTFAFGVLAKLILAKGGKNYIVLSGPDEKELDNKLGYCAADLMLYAQTLGLNTWYVGSTYNKKSVSEKAGKGRAIGIVAIGYGATQGVAHKSKKASDVSRYQGDEPDWFKNGVEAALLAPTALNKQAFYIEGKGNKVNITCNNGIFAGADLGIVKYHFELGAGIENFEWVTNTNQGGR